MTTYPACNECEQAAGTTLCDRCGQPFCGDCLYWDEAGKRCSPCAQIEFEQMREEAGGTRLLKAEAKAEREEREYDDEQRLY